MHALVFVLVYYCFVLLERILEHLITIKVDKLSNVFNHLICLFRTCVNFIFLSLLSHLSSHRQQYLRNNNSINAELNQVRQGFINELELQLIEYNNNDPN